jgi:hypothetical protein
MRLVPLPDQQPPALVLVQIEQLDGHGFGPLAVGRVDRAEIFALTADDDDAPASELNSFVGGAWIGARASARTRGVDSVLACAAGGLNTNRAVRVACSGRAARSSSAVCATRPSSATCAAPSSSATCAARSTAGTAAASPLPAPTHRNQT